MLDTRDAYRFVQQSFIQEIQMIGFIRNIAASTRRGLVTICQVVGLGLVAFSMTLILLPFLLGLAILSASQGASEDIETEVVIVPTATA